MAIEASADRVTPIVVGIHQQQYMLVGYDEHGGGIVYGARQAAAVADSLNRKH